MIRLTRARYVGVLGLCALLVIIVVILSPGIGSRSDLVGLVDAWRAMMDPGADAAAHSIAFELRLPRTLRALQVGITLALCGAVFQTLFRNPLATPYTLGIASGGALGALVGMKLGFAFAFLGVSAVSLCAFVGSLAVIGAVYLFARNARRLTASELLLAGVTMGLFCSALMLLLTYLLDVQETFWMVRWMMGSLTAVGGTEAASGLVILVPCWIVLVACGRPLNQYMLGDEVATSRGVHVGRLQVVCILFASLATAVVVAACGPIGFVGLVVPQMVGLGVGRDCRILLPASGLLGGVFLAGCDWASQVAFVVAGAATGRDLGSTSLPIGVMTAIVGVPMFLVLLRRRAR